MPTSLTSPDPHIDQALDELRSVLIDGESLIAWAVQRRRFALIHRRVIVAATSGRFIALARGLFSGFVMADVRWQDLKDAKLRVGIFGADLTLLHSGMTDLAGAGSPPRWLAYRGLIKDQAREVYRLCQANEQAWREKRRIRELEEMRAKSGGIQLGAGAPSLAANATQESGDPVARLQQAKKMLDEKLISDSEYEAIKARVIGNV